MTVLSRYQQLTAVLYANCPLFIALTTNSAAQRSLTQLYDMNSKDNKATCSRV